MRGSRREAGDPERPSDTGGEPMPAKMERTAVPGVYRRGGRYVFSYRVRGRQRWGSAPTLSEARRLKRQKETDADRGEHRDVATVGFAEHARRWIDSYQGRTARGLKEQTRES